MGKRAVIANANSKGSDKPVHPPDPVLFAHISGRPKGTRQRTGHC